MVVRLQHHHAPLPISLQAAKLTYVVDLSLSHRHQCPVARLVDDSVLENFAVSYQSF